MNVYLPLAEMSMNGLLLVALGCLSGVLSGLFGIGGGFVLTPLLVFIGVPPTIAVGTQAAQLAGTSSSGAYIQWQKRLIDIRMGLVLLIGSFAGVTAGALLFNWLKRIGHIDLTIMLGYTILLGTVGLMMLNESRKSLTPKPTPHAFEVLNAPVLRPWGAFWPLKMSFPASHLRISILAPLIIGFGCGTLTAILGVGSSFILIPAMLYLLRMPATHVAGTSMFQVLFTTAFTTVVQAILNHSVDIVLAFFLLVGSVAGVQLGSRFAAQLRPERARFFLAILILAVAAKLVFDLVAAPHNLYTLEIKAL